MDRGIHHVAILTRDIEAAIAHYVSVLHFVPGPIRSVERPGARFRTAMLPVSPGADAYVQLIEPSEGPGVAELAHGGEGALLEVGFQVEDMEEVSRQLGAAGRPAVDITGEELTTNYLTSSFGNRYVFFRREDMRGRVSSSCR